MISLFFDSNEPNALDIYQQLAEQKFTNEKMLDLLDVLKSIYDFKKTLKNRVLKSKKKK
jgi:hypothetical protein